MSKSSMLVIATFLVVFIGISCASIGASAATIKNKTESADRVGSEGEKDGCENVLPAGFEWLQSLKDQNMLQGVSWEKGGTLYISVDATVIPADMLGRPIDPYSWVTSLFQDPAGEWKISRDAFDSEDNYMLFVENSKANKAKIVFVGADVD